MLCMCLCECVRVKNMQRKETDTHKHGEYCVCVCICSLPLNMRLGLERQWSLKCIYMICFLPPHHTENTAQNSQPSGKERSILSRSCYGSILEELFNLDSCGFFFSLKEHEASCLGMMAAWSCAFFADDIVRLCPR